jgi:hypothetical protein
MTLAFVLVILALIALVIIVRLAVTQSLQIKPGSNLSAGICPIDMQAFRNLANPAEDDYLRRHLPPAQFRFVRRERLRAMAAYIQIVTANAAVLISAGEAALASHDPRLTEASRQLVNDAVLLRRNATVALARIYFALAWPYSSFAAVKVVDRYEKVSGSAMLLGRLQNPAASVRLSSNA